MSDPRIAKFASVLLHYSLEIKPDQRLYLWGETPAEELLLAVYQEAIQSGIHVFLHPQIPRAREAYFKLASDAQLDYIFSIDQEINDAFDAHLYIRAPQNTRGLTNIDSSRIPRRLKALQPMDKAFFERASRGEVRWCATAYPTHASALEANMSLEEYEEFFYSAVKVNEDNPVLCWQEEGRRQRILKEWLHGKDQVYMKGSDIDLRLSIKGRQFITANGKVNMPDGEIFTGPVEQSVNGWVRFRYPAIVVGREVEGIELWFEDGRVVKATAVKGEDFLNALLDTDEGSRYLGEWGIGTNYNISRFTKSILFDEKLGGTIHLAVGASYPETGGKNESGIHWDMVCDMSNSEIIIDKEVFYKDGKPTLWEENK